MKYLKLIRIKHYIKNGLILLPLLFSGELLQLDLLSRALVGILAFCLVSSVIYIVNDIKDAPFDKQHESKRMRPIANGTVSILSALKISAFLSLLSIVAAFFVCRDNYFAFCILILYVIFNLGYSFGLKSVPIVDIVILVSGFLFRVIFGSIITGIEISNWLYLTIVAISFYFALGKRRGEFTSHQDTVTRKVLKFYNYNFLDKNMYMCLSLAIMFYSLWCVDVTTITRIGGKNLVLTVPFIILICMRYSLITEVSSDSDPIEVLLADKILLLLLTAFTTALFLVIYY